MYQQMNYDNERPADTLTLDIIPALMPTFEMFEDEGQTANIVTEIYQNHADCLIRCRWKTA